MRFTNDELLTVRKHSVPFGEIRAIAPIPDEMAHVYAVQAAGALTSQLGSRFGLVGGVIGAVAGAIAETNAKKKCVSGCAAVYENSAGMPVLIILTGEPDDIRQVQESVPKARRGDVLPPPFDALQVAHPIVIPASHLEHSKPPAPPVPPPNQRFFLHLTGTVKGPSSLEQITALLDTGTASGETQCCREGSQTWMCVADFLEK